MTVLAAHEPRTGNAGLLEALQPAGDREPLFLVHAMLGTINCYAQLAGHLAPDRPVYGLRSPRPGAANYPLSTVEAMAQAYVEAMGNISPSRIVHVGGWSMGGLIAYEMARLLAGRGVGVGLVALIDTWMRREHLVRVRPAHHLRTLERRRWRVFLKLATGSPDRLKDDDHPFWTLSEVDRMSFILAAAREMNPRRFAAHEAGHKLATEHEAYMILRRASDAYRPGSYSGQVTCFAGAAENDQETPSVWSELARGGCAVVSCAGDHLSMVFEPFAGGLAAALAASMTAAERALQI
jgi:thioesterase domain-containing protein